MHRKALVALALLIAIPYAFADNIIRVPAPVKFQDEWVRASPLASDWVLETKNCQDWSPLADTISHGVEFNQARDCTVHESRAIQPREYNKKLNEYRLVGDPSTETRELLTSEQQTSVGSKFEGGFVVLNATPGVNGIYQVKDKQTGSVFNAYVNMTDDGGNWVLAMYWISPSAVTRTLGDFVVKRAPIRSFSLDAVQFPVIPSGVLNGSTAALLKSENAGWVSTYGSWQSFPLFEPDFQVGKDGFKANSSKGQVTLFTQSNGWNGTGIASTSFAFWTAYSYSGVCGGAGRAGTSKICPATNFSGWGQHVEGTARKFFFLKAE